MTAFNIIAQPDAAYLINDTAHYDSELVIRAFAPKTVCLTQSLMEPAALSVCGAINAIELTAIINEMGFDTGSKLIKHLPDIHTRAMQVVQAKGADPVVDGVWLAVASFDFRTGRAAGHVIAGDTDFGGTMGPAYIPGTPVGGPLGYYTTCDWQNEFGPSFNFSDPRRFDAIKHAQKMLEAQRRSTAERFPVVGGQGLVTRVSARGIETFVVCQWPDRIGERVCLTDRRGQVSELLAA